MRSLITRMSCALAALALTLTATTTASADPAPRDIVDRATTAIARSTAVATVELNAAARSGIQSIHRLAAEGAPPAVIREAAQRHLTAITTIAMTSKAQTNRIAAATIQVLDELEAPDPMLRTVAVANTSSNAAITAAAQRARAAVLRALDAALGEEEGAATTLTPKAADAVNALAA